MRKLTQLAAAAMVALPLMGFAATGTAQAADVAFSISVGYDDPRYIPYDRGINGYRYGRNAILPGYVVRGWLERDFNRVSGLDRRGDVYIARGRDWRGRDVRIVASAYTGQVIDVDLIRWNGRNWNAWARANDWRKDHRGPNIRAHNDRNDRRDWNDRDGIDRDGDGRDKDRGRR
jgi:hypothetical protein